MASPNRKDGGGLSMQTLAIASSASLAAALITSRLAPAGTVYTAALTPVIVAMVSELLHRPVNRMTELREARRTAVRAPERVRVPDDRPPDPEARLRELEERIRPSAARPAERRRWGRIHPRVVIATGVVAFVVAAAALTLPELIFGGAVANDHRTTIFGGGASKSNKADQQEAKPADTETTTETTPAQEAAPTTTETTPAETTPTETAPSGGTTAPAPAPTDTAPAQTPPSG